MPSFVLPLLGGILIGLSAVLLLLLNGRIAGISGIVGSLINGKNVAANLAFVLGLIVGPILYRVFTGGWPEIDVGTNWLIIAIAGLLVGFGTRMGSGCTSGHGVLGLARLSPRSFAAVIMFLATGVIAVIILRATGL